MDTERPCKKALRVQIDDQDPIAAQTECGGKMNG